MELTYKTYKGLLLTAGALLLIKTAATAQTATQNYVRTRVPRTGITTNARLDQLTPVKDSVMTTIQYVDGIGRPIQTVQQQASPSGYDIIQPVAYDQYGREAVKYLPYVNTSTSYGSYRADALSTTSGVTKFYNPSGATKEGKQSSGVVLTRYPYATTVFEASPLSRVTEQGAPGAAWQVSATPDSDHAQRIAIGTNEQTSSFNTGDVSSANIGSRKAALYKATINADWSRSLGRANSNAATYAPSQLNVVITKDENWKAGDGCFGTAEEYKDKEGRVVLKRTYNKKGAVAEMLSSYYVYDDLGNLCFVLPPGASPDATTAPISQATLDNFCYQYRYDSRNRLFQKKLPGKGWEFVVYNTLDQVVFTQDANQRNKTPQQWTYTKYDALGRTVITGVWNSSGISADGSISSPSTTQLTALQGILNTTTSPKWETRDNTSAVTGYTNVAIPQDAPAVYNTITFYDDYTFPGLPSMYNQLSNTLYTKRTTGLVTATKTLVLNTAGDYLWSMPYYDEDGQMIRTFTQHYVGGASSLSQYNYDDVTTGYNFARQVTSTSRYHYIANAAKTARIQKLRSIYGYSYDHMGRRRSSSSQLQDSLNAIQPSVRVSLSSYNQIGQLTKKGLHAINGTSNFLQNVDYRYNARGWLTNINNPALGADGGITNTDLNDQFGMELKYDSAATPQYNGNIGSTAVKTAAVSGITYLPLTYNYAYDKLNRLTNAASSTASATANDNYYNENMTYNVMGNIAKLNRYDKPGASRIAIDSLTYTYVSGNRIDRIDELGTAAGFINGANQAGEYTYDGNGNQLADLNKGLTQAYNMLNLPQTAVRGTVSVAYVYDATGRKLRKLSTMGATTTITEYVDGIQYEYSGTYPKISFIQTEEGRARKSGSVYKYEYDLKDHLGNTRLTTTWAPADSVSQLTPLNSQRNDYYAFGYVIQSLIGSLPSSPNHYLYNHKELQDETGLYDYGARFYDPVIGGWTTVDPLAEASRRWSPYNYVYNNPIRLIDPDGMQAVYNWDTGKYEDGDDKDVSWDKVQSQYGIAKNSQPATDKKSEGGDEENQYQGPIPAGYRQHVDVGSKTYIYAGNGHYKLWNDGIRSDYTIESIYIGGKILGPIFGFLGRTILGRLGTKVASEEAAAIIGKLTGKAYTATQLAEMLTVKEGDLVKIIYRGMSGNESLGPLFLADDASYAASYAKNGFTGAQAFAIPESNFRLMISEGMIKTATGINSATGKKGLEYIISNDAIKQLLLKSIKP